MKIVEVIIHNIRCIIDGKINVDDYSLIIGENNSGKTTLINAIRLFYEHNGYKFKESRDFPKLSTTDQESWVEIAYLTSDDEQESLKDSYKSPDKILRVRRYLKSSDKNRKGNYYAYESGNLTFENQFYGATQVGQGKLGKILYIPALSKTDDGLKMTGPSPLRDMVNFVFEKIVENNPAYGKLTDAFDEFNTEVQKEDKEAEYSISGLTQDINSEIEQFELGFGLSINKIKSTDIIKNLVSHFFKDNNLADNIDDVNSLGQGVQRHIIFTLVKLSSKYVKPRAEKKKEFSPNLTLLLFEEPEAFLHPSQQEQLNVSLRNLSNTTDNQVILTSHSTVFVSRNIEEISNLIKIIKISGVSSFHQINASDLTNLINDNTGLYTKFCNCLTDTSISDPIKSKIRNRGLGSDTPDLARKLDEEGIKYFLWLNSERCSLFFAKHVIICEGASEKIYLDYLLDREWGELKKKHIYVLDALGKYNLHRFMNLLEKIGIKHSVLYDKDQDRDVHQIINSFIESNKNSMTTKTHAFDEDFERFLGISPASRADLKPMNIMKCHHDGLIPEVKRNELKTLIEGLVL